MLPSTTHKSRNKRSSTTETPLSPITSSVNPLPETASTHQKEDPATLQAEPPPSTPTNKRNSGKAHLTRKYDDTIAELREAVSMLEEAVNQQPTTAPLDEKSVGELLDHLMRCSLAAEAIQLATRLLEENDPALAQQALTAMQKLRGRTGKWRRNSTGWFELRYVNGAGPYLYHRYRGEDGRKYTDYYGRLRPQNEELEPLGK
jgi:hypothetical protein